METILLFLCYYIAIAMIVSLLSGFIEDVGWAYVGALWPVIVFIILVVVICVILWITLGLFYKFGEMVGNLFKGNKQ